MLKAQNLVNWIWPTFNFFRNSVDLSIRVIGNDILQTTIPITLVIKYAKTF